MVEGDVSVEKVSKNDVEKIVRTMADVATENRAHFSELDAVMGDGDFGESLGNGFDAVVKKWESFDRTSIGTFLLGISTVIIANTGGCSGPIWGTLFMRSGIASKEKSELTLADITLMIRSAMEGAMARGGAELGDKTLLDALEAINIELEKHSKTEPNDIPAAFQSAADASAQATEKAKEWVAKRGRQSFTGDRSKGTLDPGMVAITKMMQAIADKYNS
jgi:dihydroxyacetone kinase phosphoprotein-dependent L subunit